MEQLDNLPRNEAFAIVANYIHEAIHNKGFADTPSVYNDDLDEGEEPVTIPAEEIIEAAWQVIDMIENAAE